MLHAKLQMIILPFTQDYSSVWTTFFLLRRFFQMLFANIKECHIDLFKRKNNFIWIGIVNLNGNESFRWETVVIIHNIIINENSFLFIRMECEKQYKSQVIQLSSTRQFSFSYNRWAKINPIIEIIVEWSIKSQSLFFC